MAPTGKIPQQKHTGDRKIATSKSTKTKQDTGNVDVNITVRKRLNSPKGHSPSTKTVSNAQCEHVITSISPALCSQNLNIESDIEEDSFNIINTLSKSVDFIEGTSTDTSTLQDMKDIISQLTCQLNSTQNELENNILEKSDLHNQISKLVTENKLLKSLCHSSSIESRALSSVKKTPKYSMMNSLPVTPHSSPNTRKVPEQDFKTTNLQLKIHQLQKQIKTYENEIMSLKQRFETTVSQISSPKDTETPNLTMSMRKVIIVSDGQCSGLRYQLQYLLGSEYSVVSFIKSGASMKNVLRTLGSDISSLNKNDFVIVLGGRFDTNPFDIEMSLLTFLELTTNTNIVISETPTNRHLNEVKLNHMLRFLCDKYANATYMDMNYSRSLPNKKRLSVILSGSILREILRLDYQYKSKKYNENKYVIDNKLYIDKCVQTDMESEHVLDVTTGIPKAQVLESDVLHHLNENHFVQCCLDILIDFCNPKEYKQFFQPNVSVSLLERKSELEVRAQKGGDVYVSVPHTDTSEPPPPSPELVTSIADVIHNISVFTNCPIQHWNEQGLYRLLFRCCSWCGESLRTTHQVRAATCRALLAVTSHKCVRTSLAATKDCLHDLLLTLTIFGEDDIDADCMESRAQGLSVLASLLVERTAIDSLWRQLRDINAIGFFHLILQCLESDEIELQDAALYCLSQLAISMGNKKHVDKSKDETCSEFYDNLKSPFWDGTQSERVGAGDSARSRDCQPEFIAEELCKALINLYQKFSMENTKHQSSQDERWVRVCSCLSSVLAVSARSRAYAVHRTMPRTLLATLHAVRDHLSLLGKPADVIRNANNSPVLRTLYWLLTVIDCSMVECAAAKESFAEENIATSLNRLWSWCMMTEQLRHAVVHLLYTFTNDCPKAWSGACSCVGGRTLVGEVCALVAREAALQAAARPAHTLLLALHTLRRLAQHHHCRAIILKSDASSSMHRLCVRTRVRGAGAAGAAWARLSEALARHADGAAALLASRAGPVSPATLPPAARAMLLPAIAHAAHHHRQTFLQSPELLELLCDTLLAGDTAEIISAARAIWALAANNHKAKLVLRSAGAAAAVHSTLQRLHRVNRDGEMQQAIQLLTYTNTVLQTP